LKITDLKVAVIGASPVIRITTDEGIDGLGPVAVPRAGHIRWYAQFYKEHIVGEDPTDVERVMLKIRRMGAFKPWGSG
jgi:L-alanine-DL-glutamate epimerase-like enolase superfamily enzyme